MLSSQLQSAGETWVRTPFLWPHQVKYYALRVSLLGHWTSDFSLHIWAPSSGVNAKGKQWISFHIRETSKNLAMTERRQMIFTPHWQLSLRLVWQNPCLDRRGFKRNCQISIRNHNSLRRWKHVRQSGVADLKRSDLLWWKVQLPLKLFIFCQSDPGCYVFAEAFMKLANLPQTHAGSSASFTDRTCKGSWAVYFLIIFQIVPCPLMSDINNHVESLINTQGCVSVSTMTLSCLLISITQYLSLITSFATLVKHFYYLSVVMFWHATDRNCVGFNVFLQETL